VIDELAVGIGIMLMLNRFAGRSDSNRLRAGKTLDSMTANTTAPPPCAPRWTCLTGTVIGRCLPRHRNTA
jgi:hypothetical protein